MQEQVPSIYDGKEKLSSEELRKKIRGEDHKIEGVKNLHIHKSDGTIDMIVALVDQAVVRDSSQLFQLLSNIVISYKQRLDGVVYLVSSARLAESFFKDDAIYRNTHPAVNRLHYLASWDAYSDSIILFPDGDRRAVSIKLSAKAKEIKAYFDL